MLKIGSGYGMLYDGVNIDIDNCIFNNWQNIDSKYNKKIHAVWHSAEARIYILQKKRDKLIQTEKRMFERENWDMYFKLVDQTAEIVDEQYAIRLKAEDEINSLRKKRDNKIDIEFRAFEKLRQYYLFLIGKKGAEKPNDII